MTASATPLPMVTRFAPSPTGRLHVGHGWSALMAMDLAHRAGGSFRLRIEDIDGTRSRAEHVAAIVTDLQWLGLHWDGEIVFQSRRLDRYDAALGALRDAGLLYPCFCTRADIQAQWAASASAPHGSEGPAYPGTCRAVSARDRARLIASGNAHAWRIDMAKAVARVADVTWTALPFMPRDMPPGERIHAAPLAHGDVVLARKDAPASYHLSCTLDDAAMGVTHVLRGDDLRPATDIHALLQALLGLPSPAYIHHRLLVAADGRRLAKRDGSIAIADLRAQGMDAAALAADLRAGRFPIGIALANA